MRLPYKEKQKDAIRYEYEQMLIENWYPSYLVSEIDDWREEFKKEYLSNK